MGPFDAAPEISGRMGSEITTPRFITAALRGGAGKTLITVGIVAALRTRGLLPAVFKKGPDYIDAGWLGLAAGDHCYNLDTYLFDRRVVQSSFLTRSSGKDVAVIEGNRGIFDGVDSSGSYSSAELAKLLRAPVVLIVDATKVTRTAAALVLGCRRMDPDLSIAAVIVNRVSGARHEGILRRAIETDAGIPVVGSVSKLALESFPQRHLGLLPLHEHPAAAQFVRDAARIAEESIDLENVMNVARSAGSLGTLSPIEISPVHIGGYPSNLRIGIMKDSSFQFYYPENLEALAARGVILVEVSALEPSPLPELDALYIGGGFPETHAERLADNRVFKESLQAAVKRGLPVYAECGGLMYLSRNLIIDRNVFPMAGIFPVDTRMERKPQGLGYIRIRVIAANPFYVVGTVLTGHEFHYSSVAGLDDADSRCAFQVLRGHGIDGSRDGLHMGNVLGTYLHVHALGEPAWADGMLRSAAAFRGMKESEAARDEDSPQRAQKFDATNSSATSAVSAVNRFL